MTCRPVTERTPSRKRREQLSNESVDTGGSQHSVHVFVVDDTGDPVTGQDVAAHFSDTGAPSTRSYQYTDVEGHAEFVCEHAAEPRHVGIVVRG